MVRPKAALVTEHSSSPQKPPPILDCTASPMLYCRSSILVIPPLQQKRLCLCIRSQQIQPMLRHYTQSSVLFVRTPVKISASEKCNDESSQEDAALCIGIDHSVYGAQVIRREDRGRMAVFTTVRPCRDTERAAVRLLRFESALCSSHPSRSAGCMLSASRGPPALAVRCPRETCITLLLCPVLPLLQRPVELLFTFFRIVCLRSPDGTPLLATAMSVADPHSLAPR